MVVSGYKDEFEELAIAFMDEWGDRTPIAWSNSAFTRVPRIRGGDP